MPSASNNLEPLSEMLAQDFLVLERKGFVHCSLIRLFGADQETLDAMAATMRKYLSRIGRREIAVLVKTNAASTIAPSYEIDAGYFLPGEASRPKFEPSETVCRTA